MALPTPPSIKLLLYLLTGLPTILAYLPDVIHIVQNSLHQATTISSIVEWFRDGLVINLDFSCPNVIDIHFWSSRKGLYKEFE